MLSLEGTELTEKDIKNQYVVTFLGGTGSSENCEQITSTNSWSNNQPIYLCMNSNGSSNLATIDPTKYGNKTYISNEPYYYQGYVNNNYVGSVINNTSCSSADYSSSRIYAIDMDDSIIVVSRLELKKCSSIRNVNKNDLKITGMCTKNSSYTNSGDSYGKTSGGTFCSEYGSWLGEDDNFLYNYIYRLPSTCKITGGTGMEDNKFEITC